MVLDNGQPPKEEEREPPDRCDWCEGPLDNAVFFEPEPGCLLRGGYYCSAECEQAAA